MNKYAANAPTNILLVEDNLGDVMLIQEGFKKNHIPSQLHVVEDGVEALDFLNKTKEFTNAITPDLILLDLNLPRKDGRSLLKDIKVDTKFTKIPVIILTSSEAEEDINACYDLHANCYITKPVNFEEFLKIIRSIYDFWFSIATLPAKPFRMISSSNPSQS